MIAENRILPPNHPIQYNKNAPITYLIMSGSQMYKYYVSSVKKRSISKIKKRLNR